MKPSYQANMSAVKWVVLLGTLFGLASLTITVPAGCYLVPQLAETLRQFPSSHTSFTELSGVVGICQVFSLPVLDTLLLFLLVVLWIWTGYILSVEVRPVDERSDIVLGISTGIVAGLSLSICGSLLAVAMSFGIVPSLGDLKALGDGFTLAQPDVQQLDDGKTIEQLLELYPALESIEPSKRGAMLMAKVLADVAFGVGRSLSLGLCIIFYGTIGTFVLQTLIGGFVCRTLNQSGIRSLLSYTELSIIVSPIAGFLISAPTNFVVYGDSPPILGWPIFWLSVSIVFTAIAFRAFNHNWSWKKRWGFYSGAAAIFGLIAWIPNFLP